MLKTSYLPSIRQHVEEGRIQIWLPPAPKAGSWPAGLHVFWALLPESLPGRLKKHITSYYSSPSRCARCAMKYNLPVTCTGKQGGGEEGFWCRGDWGIWSNAVLRALGQMMSIGNHKLPRVGLATVNTAKPREVFLAISQRLNLIWRALCQLLPSLLCSCPKSQTGHFQLP